MDKVKMKPDEDFIICGYIIRDKSAINASSILLGLYNKNDKIEYQKRVTLEFSRPDSTNALAQTSLLADSYRNSYNKFSRP